MSKRYHHKVVNIGLSSSTSPIQQALDGIDANYELVNVINNPPYEVILVFIEHTAEDNL